MTPAAWKSSCFACRPRSPRVNYPSRSSRTGPPLDKVLPRTLRVGVFAKDGTSLSEIKTMTFDSKETEARQRETTVLIVLSPAADAFNNRDVDLRLEEMVPGTTQIVTYKTHSLKLQKPFTTDFE